MQSYQTKGLPLIPDLFSTGEVASGCGHVTRTIHNGVRTTAADYIKDRPEITVKTSSYVARVVLEKGPSGHLTATGVELCEENGTRSVVKANKEVILSSGVYGTPTILLRSGIGAKADIEKHGIKLSHELPGVGKNLLDHMVRCLIGRRLEKVLINTRCY